jgi:hypothetical protein
VSEQKPSERVVTYPVDAVRDLADRLQDHMPHMPREDVVEFALHVVLDVVVAVDRLREQERGGDRVLEAENARLRRLIDRYRRPMPDGGYNWRERAHTAHVRACDAEVENARLREALSEIKRVAYIEAPPVSDEVPAKVWKLAFDALGGGDRA